MSALNYCRTMGADDMYILNECCMLVGIVPLLLGLIITICIAIVQICMSLKR